MRDVLWRLIERRLRRVLPAAHVASVLGDLAEDYQIRRQSHGAMSSSVWLMREARSLTSSYRDLADHRKPSAGPRAAGVVADLHHAIRRLVARPGTALLSSALLALGIGLATTMFSVVDALLLRPGPFRDADRLVRQGQWRPLDSRVLGEWRATGLFDQVEGAVVAAVRADEPDDPVGAWVTSGMLDMLGVTPIAGRLFGERDAGDLAIVSEAMWRSTLGGADVLGRSVTIGGTSMTVIGVMPAAFQFPSPATRYWRVIDVSSFPNLNRGAEIFGRLRPGVPVSEAETRTGDIARSLGRLPRSYGGNPPLQVLGSSDANGFVRRAMWLMSGGVVLVFLVLCANVSSLALSQLSARRREFALCSALGASRARLIREAVFEHALVGAAGAAAGVLIARAFISGVPDLFVGTTLNPIDLDARAMAAAAGLGIASMVLSGVAPAWLGTRADPIESIRGSRQAGTESRGARRATRVLLVAEIALACSLLVGAAVLMRSFVNLVQQPRGLDLAGMTHVRVGGLRSAFHSLDAMSLGVKALEDNVIAWPETAAVALSQEIPPISGGGAGTIMTGRITIPSDGYRVSPAFFDVYRIPLLKGRTFDASDSAGVIVVGDRLARVLWPDEDPVGRTIRIGNGTPRHVVGVVGEITLPTVDAATDRPEYYEPLDREMGQVYLSLRCHGACPGEGEIRRRIQNILPALLPRLYSPEGDYLAELQLPGALTQVAGAFSIVAVVTAAGGLFSVLTYAVVRRRREFGIRSALGASPRHMRLLVLGDAFAIAGFGALAGALGGWPASHALSAFQYGVTPGDPLTWGAVFGTMTVTTGLAAWRPARQAMRIDPVQLLREE